MAYKLKLDEPLDEGVRRIALQQLDRVCETLGSDDPAHWVHETRKSLKRLRALLRLVRTGVRKAEWHQYNKELRDIGRLLAGHRDRDVRRETIASLAEGGGRALAAALDRLVEHEARDGAAVRKLDSGVMREAKAKLKSIRTGLAEIAGKIALKSGHEIVEAGLARTHRTAQKNLKAIRRHENDEAFHELRKFVQIHWRQMQLLSAPWPELFQARIASARALAEDLGGEHDFAVLAQWLGGQPPEVVSRADAGHIVAACRKEQTALREKSLRQADVLFASRPRTFAREAIAYWPAAAAAKEATVIPIPVRKSRTPVSKRPKAAAARAAPAAQSSAPARERGSGKGRVRSKRKTRVRPAPAG